LKLQAVTCKDDLDIDDFRIDVGFSELVRAKCEVLEIVAVNLKLLYIISDVQGLISTEFSVERA
jgi:hypothetical protein